MNNIKTQQEFDQKEYEQQLHQFDQYITYDQYQNITIDAVREAIISNNKILKTDTYNRTMNHTFGKKKFEGGTFTLSCRKSPNGRYNVIAGVRRRIKDLFTVPITQNEVDFADAYYNEMKKQGKNGYFDKKLRQSIVDKFDGYLPIDVYAVDDGTVQTPKEPSIRVESAYSQELAALYEPLFLRIFYESAVATDARYIEEMIGSGRVVEFGNRSAINDAMHFGATRATYIGGGITGTSNDAAAALHPQLHPSGTLAHRYFAAFDTEDEAMHNAIKHNTHISLLVDYADSYSGIDKVIKLKKQYPDHCITPRLDSGDMIDQAIYAIKNHKDNGMSNPKKDYIVVSDISSTDEIYAIEKAVKDAGYDPEKRIKYGLGGLLVARNKTRSAMSAAFKLTMLGDQPKGKLSNSPLKEPTPGRINVEIRDDARVVVQEKEPVQGERLLKQVVDQGKHCYDDNDIEATSTARKKVKETFYTKDLPSNESKLTQKIHQQVRKNIQANLLSKKHKKIAI